MPFAVANTVKHIPKKSLMLAGNNMLSPKSSALKPLKLSARKCSVVFDTESRPEEDMMRCTTMSFRNQELDK